MSSPTVELSVTQGVATLTLTDPQRKNAMSPELGDALQARVKEVVGRADVRAAVLTGAGGAFSAGGDLAMLERLRSLPFEEARLHMLSFYGRYLSVLDLPVPLVAAIEGPAIGAGLCLALACDLIIVGEDSKLALNFVQLGLALESVPRAQVLSRAHALAAELASGAPLAIRALKRGLGVDRAALQAALEHEALAQAESYGSADLGEGLLAAAERRAPRFTGA